MREAEARYERMEESETIACDATFTPASVQAWLRRIKLASMQ